MKKKLLLGTLMLGSIAFAAPGVGSISDNATVKIRIQKLASIDVADMDYQTWMIGQTPGDLTSKIEIRNGSASQTMTLSTVKLLPLTRVGGTEKINATMTFTGTTTTVGLDSVHNLTLDSNGEYDTNLKANIGVIGNSQVTGDYTGTATVFLTYN